MIAAITIANARCDMAAARGRSLLVAFSGAPHYLGALGNGSKMKYVANLMAAVHTRWWRAETFTLALKAGLDPAQMYAAVASGFGHQDTAALATVIEGMALLPLGKK